MPAGGNKPNVDHEKVALFRDMAARQSRDACQLWPGTTDKKGYGRVHFKGRWRLAHDVMWEVVNGDSLPDTLTLDHYLMNGPVPRCDKSCVNLFHLEPVSNKVNVLRGNGITARRARQTHCKRGHELSADNLKPRSDGNRECKTCYELALAANRKGGSNGEKTHCKHGHEFTAVNTIVVLKRGRRIRECRTCRDNRNAHWNGFYKERRQAQCRQTQEKQA